MAKKTATKRKPAPARAKSASPKRAAAKPAARARQAKYDQPGAPWWKKTLSTK